MEIIQISHSSCKDDDYISILWQMMNLVRRMPDTPEVWKLTDPFLDAIGEFLGLEQRGDVLLVSFLDTVVDATTTHPAIVCETAVYPIYESLGISH